MNLDVLTEDISILEAIYQFEDASIPIYSNLSNSRYNSLVAEDSEIMMEGFSDMIK